MLNDLVPANGLHHGVLSLFDASPGDGALVAGVDLRGRPRSPAEFRPAVEHSG